MCASVRQADKLERQVLNLEQGQGSQLRKASIDCEALLAQISSKDEQVALLCVTKGVPRALDA